MGYFSNLLCDHPDLPSTSLRCKCGRDMVRVLGGWSCPCLLGQAIPAAPSPALHTCPCGKILGSSFCRCGRAFSAVAPRALSVGAVSAQPLSSEHAPSGLVAACLFPQFARAAAFARACPGLFGVVSPFVRRAPGGWMVRVPISSKV